MRLFQENPLLIESLSQRILRDLQPPAWQEVFIQSPEQRICIESEPAAILAARFAAGFEDSPEELGAAAGRLAEAAGGQCDLLHSRAALLSFARADIAFDAARQLQELKFGRQLCIGVTAGICDAARVQVGGQTQTFLVGETVERAQAVSAMAPAGTIRITMDFTLDLLTQIDSLVDRLITTEFDEDGVITISLALPPQRNEFLSTFAGLGLT